MTFKNLFFMILIFCAVCLCHCSHTTTENKLKFTDLFPQLAHSYSVYAVPLIFLTSVFRYAYYNTNLCNYFTVYVHIEGCRSIAHRFVSSFKSQADRIKVKFFGKKREVKANELQKLRHEKIVLEKELGMLAIKVSFLNKDIERLTEENKQLQKLLNSFHDTQYNHGMKDGMLQILGTKEEKEKLLVNFGKSLVMQNFIDYLQKENSNLKNDLNQLHEYIQTILHEKQSVSQISIKKQHRLYSVPVQLQHQIGVRHTDFMPVFLSQLSDN